LPSKPQRHKQNTSYKEEQYRKRLFLHFSKAHIRQLFPYLQGNPDGKADKGVVLKGGQHLKTFQGHKVLEKYIGIQEPEATGAWAFEKVLAATLGL
jgi:hypothetical protein